MVHVGENRFLHEIDARLLHQHVYMVADVCNITDGTQAGMNPGGLIEQKNGMVKNSRQALARVELATFWFEAKRSIH